MSESAPTEIQGPLLEVLSDFGPLAILVFDRDLRLRWASEVALRAIGEYSDDPIGDELHDFLPPEMVIPELVELLRRGLEHREHAVMALGDRRDRDMVAFPVEIDGAPCVVLAATMLTGALHRMFDEHELRESLLADAAQLGVWRLRVSDGSLEGNSWYRRVNDVGTPDLPRNRRDVAARIHPDDLQRVNATVDRAVATGEPYVMKYRLVGPAGEAKIVQSRGRVVPGRPDEVLGVVMDVTATEQAAQREAELRQLAATASDAERDRMAADLHDGPLQLLSAAWMKLGSLEQSVGQGRDAAAERTDIRSVAKLLSDANVALRDLLGRLQTLPVGASTDAFRDELCDLAERVADRSGLEVRVVCEFEHDLALADTLLSTMYRIIGEALSNVERHARATTVSIAVELFDRALVATVIDDGCGFEIAAPPPSGHFGLSIMGQRATATGGSVEISSIAGAGTTVMVRLPLDPDLEPIRD